MQTSPDTPRLRFIRWSATPARTCTATGGRGMPPEAAAWLRRHGEDYPAELAGTGGVAAGLMNTGLFGELDDHHGSRPTRNASVITTRHPNRGSTHGARWRT